MLHKEYNVKAASGIACWILIASVVGLATSSVFIHRTVKETDLLLYGLIAALALTVCFLLRHSFRHTRLAHQEAGRAKEFFQKLFYESPVGMVLSAADDGLILDCNPALLELTEFTRNELVGKHATLLNITGPDGGFETLVSSVLEKGPLRNTEMLLRPKFREPIHVALSVQPTTFSGRRCLLMTITDLTAIKEAEHTTQQALQAKQHVNKIKSDFVVLASHEFRTPLTNILTSAFLINAHAGDDKVAGLVAKIRTSVNTLTSILDDFLSLGKMEDGLIQPKIEKMNLRQLLSDVVEELKPFAKPGQTITYRHTGEEDIYSDPFLVGSIARNLVSNAIKYSPANAPIHVSSAIQAGVYLLVKDRGIGIPAADQKQLFGRFYRATNAGNVQGTGLGLHLLKRYVALLNGQVDVQSVEGEGSEFMVRL